MPRYQTVSYEVLKKDGDFEIRSYESFFTVITNESNIGETMGFNKLFSYISGNNANKEKISMTVPVINDLSENHMTTEFVMPRQFAETGPPNPDDQGVTIRRYEKHLIAAITFSGNVDSVKILNYKNQLIEWLAKTQWKTSGDFLLARYNSPFSLPFLRKNEILAILKD
ncbi:MAG: putative heme-binding protein [Fusobacteria bacterium]|nr:MAG: putative heme-binding protein [Fusobacteriota bacterium]KAF0229108.1 MAG: putative heme-binding [Fusobacteriota bacterium]